VNAGKRAAFAQAGSAVVLGAIAIVVAFVLPPRGGGVGVLPHVIGIVLIGAGIVLFAVTSRRT
jgi:hypothetical protein